MNDFVIATIPCWLIGLWNIGYQSNIAMADIKLMTLPGWRGWILDLGIGYDSGNVLACFTHGLLYFLPIFLLSLLVGSFWNVVFSSVRRRPLDEGLLVNAWLFALVLPAGVPLTLVGIGISFGLVIGKHVFGGSGRYLVNPVVLGLIFLRLAYPERVFGGSNWVPVPGLDTTPLLEVATTGGIDAVLAAGLSWWHLFLGIWPGPMGMTSLLGSLLGAGYLIVVGSASWRVMCGVLLATAGAVFVFNNLATDSNQIVEIPWVWHLVLGGLGFGTVFIATDPVAGAMTNPGRWVYGLLVGLLVIIMRVANPAFTESILFAVFLASLLAPLIDFVIVQLNINRRRRQGLADE
ncbi:MAG: RnfABCDGE type electron transport complex subunit D [Gammaproteobacteria bacterium]|nr:RnfABCDGE type electron transport complex subunit D [Gammaproteobacteria bacterium]